MYGKQYFHPSGAFVFIIMVLLCIKKNGNSVKNPNIAPFFFQPNNCNTCWQLMFLQMVSPIGSHCRHSAAFTVPFSVGFCLSWCCCAAATSESLSWYFNLHCFACVFVLYYGAFFLSFFRQLLHLGAGRVGAGQVCTYHTLWAKATHKCSLTRAGWSKSSCVQTSAYLFRIGDAGCCRVGLIAYADFRQFLN